MVMLGYPLFNSSLIVTNQSLIYRELRPSEVFFCKGILQNLFVVRGNDIYGRMTKTPNLPQSSQGLGVFYHPLGSEMMDSSTLCHHDLSGDSSKAYMHSGGYKI